MPQTRIYSGSAGIANTVDPELIPFDPRSGVAGLQVANNMLIGRAGELYSRLGSRQLFAGGSCHSPVNTPSGLLFACDKDDGLGTAIMQARPDSTGSLVISEIARIQHPENWLSWFELAGDYWFSTQQERGIITADHQLTSWPNSTEMMSADNTLKYARLPFGRHIERHGKSVISATGQAVFYSEPSQEILMRELENIWPAEGSVRLLASVQEGLYVSDDKSIWFLSGIDCRKWVSRKVLNYPAIEYCKAQGLVDSTALGFESPALGTVFMTVKGPVFGFPDGTIMNLTNKKFALPRNCGKTKGSMMLVNESMLIISTV